MKSFHNNVLNQIKELDKRLEDKIKITKEFKVYEEHLQAEKEIVEEEQTQLFDEVKILEVRANKGKEQLEKQAMHELDNNENQMSDLSNKSNEGDNSNNSSQWTMKLRGQ